MKTACSDKTDSQKLATGKMWISKIKLDDHEINPHNGAVLPKIRRYGFAVIYQFRVCFKSSLVC
jgi:hypothetical protein